MIDRLKLAYGIRTDAALAAFLGIKPNTISMWKKRRVLDFNLIFTKCDDISASWLLTGEGSKDNLDIGQGSQGIPINGLPGAVAFIMAADGHGRSIVGEPGASYESDSVTAKIMLLLKDMPEEARLEILRSVEEKKLLRELLEERKRLKDTG